LGTAAGEAVGEAVPGVTAAGAAGVRGDTWGGGGMMRVGPGELSEGGLGAGLEKLNSLAATVIGASRQLALKIAAIARRIKPPHKMR
jgi:hypothetical protein